MLQERAGLAIVVDSRLDGGGGIQHMMRPQGEGVLLAGQAVRELRSYRRGRHGHRVGVGRGHALPLVVPALVINHSPPKLNQIK